MTHKSYVTNNSEEDAHLLSSYERLEFLGDSIINFVMAEKFFLDTQGLDAWQNKPKELHKKKASIVNNALLSLVIVEKDMDRFIICSEKAQSFKEQIGKFIDNVHKLIKVNGRTEDIAMKMQNTDNTMDIDMLNEMQSSFISKDQITLNCSVGTIKTENAKQEDSLQEDDPTYKPIDLDLIYEHSLKIFGDIFESLVGAIFLDCEDIERTKEIILQLLGPYTTLYSDLSLIQEHGRTLVLELWNSKDYTKQHRLYHESDIKDDEVFFYGKVDNLTIFQKQFKKDDKNKIRHFYKVLNQIVSNFLTKMEAKYNSADKVNKLMAEDRGVERELNDFIAKGEVRQAIIEVEEGVYTK